MAKNTAADLLDVILFPAEGESIPKDYDVEREDFAVLISRQAGRDAAVGYLKDKIYTKKNNLHHRRAYNNLSDLVNIMLDTVQ